MDTARPIHRFRIVAAIDRTEYAEIVLEHAIDQAARHEAPDLDFITVVSSKDDLEAVKNDLTTKVIQSLELLGRKGPDWRSRVHVVVGEPAEEITNLAADLNADLLIVGRFGAHDKRRSFANAVVTRATCPLLVVGLTEHGIDTVAQCPDCVAVREDTGGERWFCSTHAAAAPLRLSSLIPGTTAVRGGPLL